MPSSSRSIPVFPVVVALTLACSLLPTRFLVPWTSDLTALASLPVAPFGDASDAVGTLLRGPREPNASMTPEDRARVQVLEEERERFQRLWRQSEKRVGELEEQVRQLQLVPMERFTFDVSPLQASVVSRDPASSVGVVTLNRGARSGIERGAVAVYEGIDLLGRVTAVERLHAMVLPLSNPATGYVRAVVVPREKPDLPLDDAPRVQLLPAGDGTLHADADEAHGIQEGDIVRLLDESWPETAQAMRIGVVEMVRPKETQPLRRLIVVRPRRQVRDVHAMTLLIERPATGDADDAFADGSGEGSTP